MKLGDLGLGHVVAVQLVILKHLSRGPTPTKRSITSRIFSVLVFCSGACDVLD
jgi:hypothetical protein